MYAQALAHCHTLLSSQSTRSNFVQVFKRHMITHQTTKTFLQLHYAFTLLRFLRNTTLALALLEFEHYARLC